MTRFQRILARAEARKGGPEALAKLLPPTPDPAALRSRPDAAFLAEMTRRVFCAGFVWKVIDQKWPGFEAAFEGFDPDRLVFAPDAYWDGLTRDPRIVRNGAKIFSVRTNADLVRRISADHGGFGAFLADWPSSDEIGLLDVLARRGSRLGGATGQLFLRFAGWDGFVLSADVAACLIDAGLDIRPNAVSKSDLRKVQSLFNAFAEESGLCYTHISRICALSVGENRSAPHGEGDLDV